MTVEPEEVVWMEPPHRIAVDVLGVTITDPMRDGSDDDFVEEATVLVDDLILLISFLSDAP
jgi:hypothetical protein